MQSVFLRVLQEHNSGNIRLVAGNALCQIIEFHPKPDSIINELTKMINGADATQNTTDLYVFFL